MEQKISVCAQEKNTSTLKIFSDHIADAKCKCLPIK